MFRRTPRNCFTFIILMGVSIVPYHFQNGNFLPQLDSMNEQQKKEAENIIVWRDSVTAGDNVFSPHEIEIKVDPNESIETTLEKIILTRYLPSIRGGKATWIVVGKNPLAVIGQQWSKPHFL